MYLAITTTITKTCPGVVGAVPGREGGPGGQGGASSGSSTDFHMFLFKKTV